jgi:hypothetical protein
VSFVERLDFGLHSLNLLGAVISRLCRPLLEELELLRLASVLVGQRARRAKTLGKLLERREIAPALIILKGTAARTHVLKGRVTAHSVLSRSRAGFSQLSGAGAQPGFRQLARHRVEVICAEENLATDILAAVRGAVDVANQDLRRILELASELVPGRLHRLAVATPTRKWFGLRSAAEALHHPMPAWANYYYSVQER